MKKELLISYYDQYVEAQAKTGINERHHAILHFLKKKGLRRNHRVLEVGCGIGTLSWLLARYLSGQGQLTAIDISPKSVETARQRLSRWPNVRVLTGDILHLALQQHFEVIILPDVLEHIALAEHPLLFQRLRTLLTDDGFMLIHLPEPRFLAWSQTFEPENMQIIDQPVYTDRLLMDAYPAGLYLDYLHSYCLWRHSPDYQVIILKNSASRANYTLQKRPWHRRLGGKIKRLFREKFFY